MNEYLTGLKPGILLKKVFDPGRFIVGGAYHVKTGKSHDYRSYACLLSCIKDDELHFVYRLNDDDPQAIVFLTSGEGFLVIKLWEYESGDVTITHLSEGNVV